MRNVFSSDKFEAAAALSFCNRIGSHDADQFSITEAVLTVRFDPSPARTSGATAIWSSMVVAFMRCDPVQSDQDLLCDVIRSSLIEAFMWPGPAQHG